MGCTHARPVTSSKDVHPAPNTTQPPAPSQQGFDIDFPGLIPAKTLVEEDYELGELLGKGSFGSVYSGRDRRTGEVVAVKVMDRTRIKSASIAREWTVLSHLGFHPHVVQFHKAYVTQTQVSFVMELMRGGELFDRLIQRGAYSEAEARKPFHQVAMALHYLHTRGIIHRDLKPENLLLCDDTQESAVKIADFGLSQLVTPGEKMTKICGTWAYAAPEMSDPQAGGYDCKYDTWGFGVILFVVLSGYHPFDPEGGLPVPEIKARARAAVFDFEQPEWEVVSDLAKDLLKKLIVKNPVERLDSEQLLRHPWFTGIVPTEPIAMDMGTKISAYQKRRRKLKASFYSSFFVASLLISASAAAKRRSLADMGEAPTANVTSGSLKDDEDVAVGKSDPDSPLRKSPPTVTTAGTPPSYVVVSPAQRLIQENKMSTRQSPSRRMGTPTTGRLATIPSATGQAAKQAYDRDDDDDGGVGEQLSPALEHQGDDDGTPRRKSVPHGNKVVPVTLEEVDE